MLPRRTGDIPLNESPVAREHTPRTTQGGMVLRSGIPAGGPRRGQVGIRAVKPQKLNVFNVTEGVAEISLEENLLKSKNA